MTNNKQKMKKDILKYIRTNKLMALSTMGRHIWTCWVFFLIDDDFTLYFISPDSQHTRDIKNNDEVACAITDTTQDPACKKVGIQIYGKAEQIKGPQQLKWFFNMWKKVIASSEKLLTYDNYLKKAFSSKVYKVTPIKVKWFNQNLENEEYLLKL
jgi:uncharacterized protein YhbP (UPF0306 family)